MVDQDDNECETSSLSSTSLSESENSWRIYLRKMLPHTILYLMLIGYILTGAAIIHVIEGPNDPKQRDLELRKIFNLRDDFKSHIWNMTQNSNRKLSLEEYNSINQQYFEKLAKNIFKSYKSQLINENHLLNSREEAVQLWTYSNSIFFATTVMTTIGYGSLMPTTTLGRIACVILAVIGIPLLRVTIEDIGAIIEEIFIHIYRHCRTFIRKDDYFMSSDLKLKQMPGGFVIVLLAILPYIAVGGLLFQSWQESEYLKSLFSCFSVMATIGYSDIVPTTQLHIFFTIAYIIFGLSLANVGIDVANYVIIRNLHFCCRTITYAKEDLTNFFKGKLRIWRKLNTLAPELTIKQKM